MVRPTGTSAPAWILTPPRTPSPGDSISITALSVSISSRGSPLATDSPSFFSHEMSLPVSWAISSAGITTLIPIVRTSSYINLFSIKICRWSAGRPRPAETRQAASLQECFSVTYANSFLPGACFDHLANAGARLGFRLSNRGKRTIDREIVSPGYQKLLGRKAGDDFVASFRDDD